MTDTVNELSPQATSASRDRFLALALTLVGLAAAITLGALSDDFYHDDDINHYLKARDAWGSLQAVLWWWGRPGHTIPTMFVAHFFGLEGCRAFSALQTGLVAWLAYLIALRIGVKSRWAAFAPLLVWVQPLTMLLAATTLTETPAAVYMTLGIWLYLRGNRVWACVAMSPMFITRIETLALAPLLAVAVVTDALRQADWKIGRALKTRWAWTCALLILWAPIVYAIAAYWAEQAGILPRVMSPIHIFTDEHTKEYGRGAYWYHYLIEWSHAATLGAVSLAMGGALHVWRKGWLVCGFGLGLVLLHGVLYHFGLFASGGYGRFLVAGAGMFAVLAAAGLEGVWHRRRSSVVALCVAAPAIVMMVAYSTKYWTVSPDQDAVLAMSIALAAVMLPMAVVVVLSPGSTSGKLATRAALLIVAVISAIHVGVQVRPLTIARNSDAYHAVCKEAIDWANANGYAGRQGLTQHVFARYLMGGDNSITLFSNEDAIDKWQQAETGTIFLWEGKYCDKVLPQTNEEKDAGAELIRMKSTHLLNAELKRLGTCLHTTVGPPAWDGRICTAQVWVRN